MVGTPPASRTCASTRISAGAFDDGSDLSTSDDVVRRLGTPAIQALWTTGQWRTAEFGSLDVLRRL